MKDLISKFKSIKVFTFYVLLAVAIFFVFTSKASGQEAFWFLAGIFGVLTTGRSYDKMKNKNFDYSILDLQTRNGVDIGFRKEDEG